VSDWRTWWWAARPKTLPAAVAPVLMGTALAYYDGAGHALSAGVALLVAVLIQVGTNYCNDYADFQKGADTAERIGPVRATQAGWVTPQAMKRVTVWTFAMAALAASYLIIRGGPWLALVAIASIGAGVGYTVGRYALAYIGLGELFVLVFFGPVALAGTYYVQTLTLPLHIVLLGLVPGGLSCAILAVNNLRDIEQDRKAGKRTLAVRFGAGFARIEYSVCVLLPLIGWPMGLRWGAGWPPIVWLLLGVLGLAWRPLHIVWSGATGATLNPVLGQTGKVLLALALSFTFLMILFIM